jgi:hypothetical protein
MLASLQSAREVTFSSYFLKPGPVVDALLKAAGRPHSAVHVRLEAALYGGSKHMDPENRAAFESLKGAGIDVQLVEKPDLHMKAAVCDGVAFLDDRNWNTRGDTIVRDDTRSHVKAIRDAILQRESAGPRDLRLTKTGALYAEAHMLRAKHVSGVDVETEFLGGSPVSKALRELRAKNMRCRVLISAQAYDHGGPTSDAAHSLAKIGVDVRIAKANDKLAVAGTHAWIGSANASSTRPNPDAVEWSLTTANPRVAREIRSRFNQNWRASSALPR